MASRDHPSFFDDVTALPPPPANLVELGKWIPHTVEFSVDLGGDRQRVFEPPSEDVLAAYARSFLPVAPAARDFRTRSNCATRSSLTDAHGAVPARHEVAHVFNSWTEMPTFREQIDLPWTYRGVDPRPTPIRALAAAMTGEG